jgi:hypothetical protein
MPSLGIDLIFLRHGLTLNESLHYLASVLSLDRQLAATLSPAVLWLTAQGLHVVALLSR